MMHIRSNILSVRNRWAVKHDLQSSPSTNVSTQNLKITSNHSSVEKDLDATSTKHTRRRRRTTSLRTPRISHQSSIISSPEVLVPLHASLPARFSGSDWQAVYSTMRDGVSLQTLYSRCNGPNPVIMLIRDTNGATFGCYSSVPWKISNQYYGTGESFVFTIKPNFNVYKWSRTNKLFQLGANNSFAVGGGGKFALFFDSMLEHGSSGPCATYNSPCLASKDQFDIVVLEVYQLVSPSKLQIE